MPLSEHEQRMLDEIESALYAEDPKFASSVTKRRVGRPTARRRLIASLGFLIGLAMLVGGLMVDFEVGGLKILSFAGFLVMFGAAAFGLLAPNRAGTHDASGSQSGPRGDTKQDRGGRPSFSERMESRFQRRFEQDDS
ncbi:DUF3040 domain-containing protein [Gordonia sp. HY002]|uniref:DUF3040 domain-containing protein n=1 Tax=Gordonia zhenghanii TaxID=2911516 RepID=UPI001EEF7CF8|nr:DUF3040 domain-containing protein [Gordonia zhenghanii]MCF8570784.1 DUF3040 domain-containing protein [Gordonia zhenghanii]MCF8603781.1 DUF3040 domain-containing protein [Gordonia zhenghanii]